MPGGAFTKDLEMMRNINLIEANISDLKQALNQEEGMRRSSLQGSNQTGGFFFFFERIKDVFKLKPRIQGDFNNLMLFWKLDTVES